MKKGNRKKREKKMKPIDAWVEANYERLILKPGIQKLFGIKKEEAFNLISKELQADERERDNSLGRLEPLKIRYTDKEIKELAATLNWNGKGTENDPFIVNSTEGLPKKFLISSKLFIVIKDCSFDHMILYDCQHIALENCTFDTFGILNSSEIMVKRSSLSNLDLDHCNNSNFKECSISNAYNHTSRGNTFLNCTVTNEVRDLLLKELNGISELLKQLPWILIVLGCGIAFFTFLDLFNSTPFGPYWYLWTIIFIGLIILYVLLSRYLRKIPHNIIKSISNLKEN